MAQFTKILVPVDFEPASDEAVEQGRAVPAGEHHVEFSPASLRRWVEENTEGAR